MDFFKLILDAWPILWVLPLCFGILTSVVVVNEMRPIVRALRSDVARSATSSPQSVEGGTTAVANA